MFISLYCLKIPVAAETAPCQFDFGSHSLLIGLLRLHVFAKNRSTGLQPYQKSNCKHQRGNLVFTTSNTLKVDHRLIDLQLERPNKEISAAAPADVTERSLVPVETQSRAARV